jgi:hypothetical protein
MGGTGEVFTVRKWELDRVQAWENISTYIIVGYNILVEDFNCSKI